MQDIVQSILGKMIAYFSGDVRRINHGLKVYSFAQNIGKLEQISQEEQFILELAAILHDIGIKESERKYNSASGKYQELEGPPIARGLLEAFDIEPHVVERVCFLIGNHHSYGKIDRIDFQILVEADFLVNIFEDQMSQEQIDGIQKKYFRTAKGKEYLEILYRGAYFG